MLFRVKICGITTPDDARLVASARADAIGLNFVSGSPRALDVEQARAVAEAVPAGVLKVGVFAGTAAAEIRRIVAAVGLDAVQLHGHLQGKPPAVDPPALCAELAGLKLIRAVRMEAGSDPLAAARRWLAEAAALGATPEAVIIDAAVLRETEAGHPVQQDSGRRHGQRRGIGARPERSRESPGFRGGCKGRDSGYCQRAISDYHTRPAHARARRHSHRRFFPFPNGGSCGPR